MQDIFPPLDAAVDPQSDKAEDSKTVVSGVSEAPGALPLSSKMPTTTPSPARSQPLLTPTAGVSRTILTAAPQPEILLAWLGVVSGPGAAREDAYVLLRNTLIGRAAGNTVLSGDKTISSQHARVGLEPKEGGAEGEQVFVIYDLTSTNGTFVGARETVGDEAARIRRRELHPGDYILLGQTTLVYLQA